MIKKTILAILILVPIIFYFIVLVLYGINFPFYDDYQTVLKLANDFTETHNTNATLNLVVKPQNEHRIVLSNLYVFLSTKFFGNVNFNHMRLFGNISILLLAGLFYFKTNLVNNLTGFLPVVFLLFQFNGWENNFWGMPAISNLWVVFLAALTYYLFSKNDKLYYLSALVCVFTNGNGLFVFVPIILSLVLQKQWKKVFYSIFIQVALGFIYVLGHNLKQQSDIFADFLEKFAYFFAFLGNNFALPGFFYLSIAISMVLILLLFILCFKDKKIYTHWVFTFVLFILITAAITALRRYSNGIIGASPSRYKIYGTVFLVSIYILIYLKLLNSKHQVTLIRTATFFAIIFFTLNNILYFQKIEMSKQLRIGDILRVKKGLEIGGSPHAKECSEILKTSTRLKTYNIPDIKYIASYPIEKHIDFRNIKEQNMAIFIDTMIRTNTDIFILGAGCNTLWGSNFVKTQNYIVSKTDTLEIPTLYQKNYKNIVNNNINYCVDGGFINYFNYTKLTKNTYTLFVKLTKLSGKFVWFKTNTSITI